MRASGHDRNGARLRAWPPRPLPISATSFEPRTTVVSHHAADELEDDNLTILDLESIVLTGKIVERQHDQNTRETKYIVNGSAIEGTEAETVVKIGFYGTLIFITVYIV